MVSFLERAGFSNVQVSPNNLIVSADGTIATATAAFKTNFESYNQFGNVVFGNLSAPQIPASLGSIVGAVLGLNSIGVMKPGAKYTFGAELCGQLCAEGFFLLCRIYDGEAAQPASNVSIAIIAEGDLTQVTKDLRTAEQMFGTVPVPYTIVQVGLASTDTSGMDEFDMDSQYSTGMAGSVKMLYMYDATSLTDSDLALAFSRVVTDNLAQAASASLGECEVFPYIDGSMLVDDETFAGSCGTGADVFRVFRRYRIILPCRTCGRERRTGGSSAGAISGGEPICNRSRRNLTLPRPIPFAQTQYGSTYTYNTETSWYAGGGGLSQFEASGFWQQPAFLFSA